MPDVDQPDLGRASATWQLGLALVALAGGLWMLPRASGPAEMREGTFFWVLALIVLPLGLTLVASGVAERLRLPGWRVLRWLPLVGLLASYLTCTRIF